METYAVYFRPLGGLSTPITSDLLFGATCWGIHELGLDLAPFLDPGRAPRFVFSNAFPCWSNKELVFRYYPIPFSFHADPVAINESLHKASALSHIKIVDSSKRMKKIHYVTEDLFTRIIKGEVIPSQIILELTKISSEFKPVGNFLFTKEDLKQINKAGLSENNAHGFMGATQHNQIDRVTSSTGDGLLFYEDDLRFPSDSELWSVLAIQDSHDLETIIKPALRYLSDTGLGGNRTSGKGQFEITIGEKISLPNAGNTANGFMTLSRYLPIQNEWSGNFPLSYQLCNLWAKREKKFSSTTLSTGSIPIYKQRTRLFDTGSVFPISSKKEIYGRLVKVVNEEGNDHAVYQSGYGLPVFLKVPKGENHE
jgi:CRISPR type III-A-associated RAMP protein Csm4